MEDQQLQYWQERGKLSCKYKGEVFYTITPIPHYYIRRKLLLNLTYPIVKNKEIIKICDFGCGDGWYLKHFASLFPEKEYSGTDISEIMIARAIKQFPNATYTHGNLNKTNYFDLIYCFVVLAHITDIDTLNNTINSIGKATKLGGTFLMFELNAPSTYGNSIYQRRPHKFYIDRFKDIGFEVVEEKLFYFNVHKYFEKYIAKFWYNYLSKGENAITRKLNANKSLIFRSLSLFFNKISINSIRKPNSKLWGYSYIVFKKHSNY